MFLPIRIEADWARIQEKRQKEMQRNNIRENRSRIDHTYTQGEKVLLDKPGILRKMTVPRQGPYEVERVYTNGTIRIRRGAISERVNLRRVTPYTDRDDAH